MSVPAPTIGRFVQVNIAPRCVNPVWRPALVVQDWPNEFNSNPVCAAGLNVQVFLDGGNDARTLCDYVAQSYANANTSLPDDALAYAKGLVAKNVIWVTSLPHESYLEAQPDYRGMVWRWPPREGA